MRKLKTKTVDVYDAGDDFIVEIELVDGKFGAVYGAWLYQKNGGIKYFMFGAPKDDLDKDGLSFENTVSKILVEHKYYYQQEHPEG